MANSLKVYKNINGEQSPFPNNDEQVVVSSFRYDAKRMGGAPIISCIVNHEKCLDNLWSRDVFVEFRGEKYYLKQTPTSSHDNTDARYKHEVEFVSERVILDNVYFYDVVTSDANVDKVVSNSTSFTFSGDIHEFAKRLNMSLARLNVGYIVAVDSGVKSDVELVTFENQFITNVLQTMYDVYKIPYYFVGKVIRIGEYQDTIKKVFKYGAKESLLSITKNNANSKTINRITGQGSSDNIPYYYPNDDAKGLTSVLYNGETGIASIINQSLYRRVKLSDKFVYESNAQTRVSVLSESNYHFGSARIKQQDKNEGEPNDKPKYLYSVDFYYTIDLNQYENVEFNVSSQYETKSLKFEVYKTSGVHYGTFKDTASLQLTGGVYNFIVKWEFFSDVVFEFDNDIQKLIDENLSISAHIVVDSTNTWTYNGVPVNLASYGLSAPYASNGDTISFRLDKYIHPQPKLMPSIYRNSEGEERFYNAINDTYENEKGDGYYVFDNLYASTHPKEHIENFDNIKPTIKNVQNSQGEYIDSFIDFAYDELDNDDVDENNEFIHPYFYAKLRRLDGDYGFNLFDHAIESNEMVVSMVDGSCASCEFAIMVDSKTQKNTVLVDSNGNLLRDSKGNVKHGTPQDAQNDTINNEVWITLKKNLDTYGVIMPNASNKYRPSSDDKFVLLHIDLPKAYVEAAEKKLEKELIKFMAENNSEKFSFSISFSRIFFKENPNVLNSLTENSKIKIEYNGQEYDLYVSSISYNVDDNSILPDIRVELADVLSISQNQIQQIVLATEKRLLEKIGDTPQKVSIVEPAVAAYNGSSFDEDNFLRKDQDDRSSGMISSDKGFEVGKFVNGQIGGTGAKLYIDDNKKSVLEVDRILGREDLIVPTITFNNTEVVSGDKANTFAYGKIKEVDTERQIAKLDLLDGEWGTLKQWDILRGVFHNAKGGNNIETKEDENGFLQYSGFFTSYFTPTEILLDKEGEMEFRYSLQNADGMHPCAGMKFYAYGNFFDADRQSITYENREYRRRLVNVNTWDIQPSINIAMQDGNLDNLTIGGFEMNGYGTFQTNSYFTGANIQFSKDQLEELKGLDGSDAYSITLSSYDGIIKIDEEGKITSGMYSTLNVVAGSMNVITKENNVVITDFILKTSIQASKGNKPLSYYKDPKVTEGAFFVELLPVGCSAKIESGVVYVTEISDLNRAYITIRVNCEGNYRVEQVYRINAVYDGSNPIIADIDNEMDSVACDSDGKVLFGLPVSCNVSVWAGTKELKIDKIELSTPQGVTASVDKNKITVTEITKDAEKTLPIIISVTTTYAGKVYTKTLVFTVNKIVAGENSLIYKLLPSASVVKVSNLGEMSTNSISCSIIGFDGKKSTVLTLPLPETLSMKYSLNGQDKGDYAYASEIQLNEKDKEVEFRLYDKGICVDIEGIPVVRDGDGTEIETIYSKEKEPAAPENVHPYIDNDIWSHHSDGESVWMAVATRKNNTWSEWKVTRILGFKGNFISFVFCRTNEEPSAPIGGSYESPIPDENLSGRKWTDGVPDGEATVWMSSYEFSVEEDYSNQASVVWNTPQRMTDTASFEAIYSEQKERPSAPSVYPDIPGAWNPPSPWTDDPTSNSIWMATATKHNGVWSPWVVSKIKGEDGLNALSYEISPPVLNLRETLTGTIVPTATIFTCYQSDEKERKECSATWGIKGRNEGQSSWVEFDYSHTGESMTFSPNQNVRYDEYLITAIPEGRDTALEAQVVLTKEKKGVIPRYCGHYQEGVAYYYNDDYRDIVIYKGNVFQVYPYNPNGSVSTTPNANIAEGSNDGYWEKANKFSFVAMDTALIDSANIAGFTFTVDGTDQNGNPLGTLKSQNEKIVLDTKKELVKVEGEIIANSGFIGGFNVGSNSLFTQSQEYDDTKPNFQKSVTISPEGIHVESFDLNPASIRILEAGNCGIEILTAGKTGLYVSTSSTSGLLTPNAITSNGNVYIDGNLVVTGTTTIENSIGGSGVDTVLSSTSKNPIANSTVNTAVEDLKTKIANRIQVASSYADAVNGESGVLYIIG